jgi:hypothetical protein
MRTITLLLLAAGATGCTRPAAMGLAPLDKPAFINSTGAESQSQVTMYRQGALDPATSLVVVPVRDATVQVSSTLSDAIVEELVLRLADVDLGPSQTMPQGVKLRNQELRITSSMAGHVEGRAEDELDVTAKGALAYHASMLLPGGTLAPLGSTEMDEGELSVRITRWEFGVHVTLDAAPRGACWSVPGVLEISNCSLYVESNGDATSQH